MIGSVMLAICQASGSALADDNESVGGQDISQAASDPTASLMALQFSDWYAVRYHENADASDNTLVFRPVIPFSTGSLNHIFRATLPVITDNPYLESGLADSTVFDLVVFNENWGRWGVGAVALLPTGGQDSGAEKWGIGPAAGFTARSNDLLWGLFNQNVFSVAGNDDRADVNISTLQPILSYKLGDGWSVGFSEMSITYDWDQSKFVSLPLGLNVSKMVRVGNQPVQFSTQYEHNFYDDGAVPSDTLRFTMKLLFPTG